MLRRILRCRKYVHAVISKCVYCKRFLVKSKKCTKVLIFRVSATYPFQYTGVDYLGPLMINPINNEYQTEMSPVHDTLSIYRSGLLGTTHGQTYKKRISNQNVFGT